uniref:C2H2-type domain-containing protein n=1 Tax=Timema bartmani TaxID=61472 RepID=A0A7R9I309_9NEOP|nr:unnamed protein product [Timema bartmani]
MSCKGTILSEFQVSGQIEDTRNVSNEILLTNTRKDAETSTATVVLGHDISETSSNGEMLSTNILDLPVNFIFSSSCELAQNDQELGVIGVEEWLKQKTDSISNVDLDNVIKTEVIDTQYFSENLGHNFLSNKTSDVVDICIGTNSCDLKPGLHDSPNQTDDSRSNVLNNTIPFIQHKNEKTHNLKMEYFSENLAHNYLADKGNDVAIGVVKETCDHKAELHSSSKGHNTALLSNTCNDPMLSERDKNEFLHKDILLENGEVATISVKIQHPSQTDPTSNDTRYSNTKVSDSIKNYYIKGNLITNRPNVDGQQTSDTVAEIVEAKTMDHFYTRGNLDDCEKEMDYSDFSLLSYQSEPSNDMGCTNLLPQIDFNKKFLDVLSKDNVVLCAETYNIVPPLGGPVSLSVEDTLATKKDNTIKDNPCIKTVSSSITHKNKEIVPNSRTLLNNSQKLLSSSQTDSASISRPDVSKRLIKYQSSTPQRGRKTMGEALKEKNNSPKGMAFIAISTDKSKNTTEIVINTPRGEQVLKGKTTDLMKATSNLWVKLEKISNKSSQTLTISSVESPKGEPDTSRKRKLKKAAKRASSTSSPTDNAEGENHEDSPDEQPVLEALAELGITPDSLFWVMSNSGHKLWVCPTEDCKKMYPRQSMLKVHILSHHGIRPYRCPKCDKRFTTIYNLNAHIKLHRRPAEMACPVDKCKERFQTKRNMEVHMKTHDVQHAPYKCMYQDCGKYYYSANALNSHYRIHQHKEEELRCQWGTCNKLFDQPCRLKAHMRSHTGDKPYSCLFEGCGGAFSTASKLKRHQMRHYNLRKFRCTFEGCSKMFLRSEHLREHMHTHLGQRSFQCPVENCGVRFSARSTLYVHHKKHLNKGSLSEKVDYHCPIEQCSKSYSSKSTLRQHMLMCHTPILASDSSQLDYIALLTGDDDLTLDGLQFADGTHTTSNDFQFTSDLGAPFESGGSVITHVVLAPPDEPSSTLAVSDSGGTSHADVCTTTEDPPDILEGVSSPSSPVRLDVTQGAARTNITFPDFLLEKKRIFNTVEPTPLIGGDVSMLRGDHQDMSHHLLMQDDFAISHHGFYQDDHMMTIGAGVSEFQVLLLDAGGSTEEFAESTINLRDLE